MKKILILIVIVILGWGALIVWARNAKPPTKLGASQGRLAACPDSPNCVSSQAQNDEHAIAPLEFSGDHIAAMERLRAVISANPRATVVNESDGYLHAEYRSRIVGYVDDIECIVDPDTKVIHVRSASRVGYSDMGVNRKRVESIRADFGS